MGVRQGGPNELRISAERIEEELWKLVETNIADVIEWDNTGVRLKDLSKVSRDQLAGVKKLSVVKKGDVCAVEVQLHDSLRALELLGKMYGLFSEKREVSGTPTTIVMVDYDRAKKFDKQKGADCK